MLTATGEHGATINDLTQQKRIKPVAFTTPDGVYREANSVWAATDWIKASGLYEKLTPIIWHLENPR